MDFTQWYAVFSGALIGLPMIIWAVRCISSLVQKYQHGLYEYVSISKKITLLEAFLMLAVLVANAICTTVDVHSAQMLIYRSRLVLTINFAFLLFRYYISSLYKSSSLLLLDYNYIYY